MNKKRSKKLLFVLKSNSLLSKTIYYSMTKRTFLYYDIKKHSNEDLVNNLIEKSL